MNAEQLQDIHREADIIALQVRPFDSQQPDDMKRYIRDLVRIQAARAQRDEDELIEDLKQQVRDNTTPRT